MDTTSISLCTECSTIIQDFLFIKTDFIFDNMQQWDSMTREYICPFIIDRSLRKTSARKVNSHHIARCHNTIGYTRQLTSLSIGLGCFI